MYYNIIVPLTVVQHVREGPRPPRPAYDEIFLYFLFDLLRNVAELALHLLLPIYGFPTISMV